MQRRLRPGVLVLACGDLRGMGLGEDSAPNDVLNWMVYVGRRYGLTPLESCWLHGLLREGRTGFERKLRGALNAGRSMRAPRIPDVGDTVRRRSDGALAVVDRVSSSGTHIVLKVGSGEALDFQDPFTLWVEYEREPVEVERMVPVRSRHRRKARGYAKTEAGVLLVAQALADLEERGRTVGEAADRGDS